MLWLSGSLPHSLLFEPLSFQKLKWLVANVSILRRLKYTNRCSLIEQTDVEIENPGSRFLNKLLLEYQFDTILLHKPKNIPNISLTTSFCRSDCKDIYQEVPRVSGSHQASPELGISIVSCRENDVDPYLIIYWLAWEPKVPNP